MKTPRLHRQSDRLWQNKLKEYGEIAMLFRRGMISQYEMMDKMDAAEKTYFAAVERRKIRMAKKIPQTSSV